MVTNSWCITDLVLVVGMTANESIGTFLPAFIPPPLWVWAERTAWVTNDRLIIWLRMTGEYSIAT